MDKMFQELCENLTAEIKPLARKQDLTVSDLDSIYKGVKTIYYIKTMSAMDDYSDESSRGYDRNYRMSRDGNYDNMRYSREGNASEGYDRRMDSYRMSGHGEDERMIEELEQMARQSNDSHMQNAIRECINRIRK